MEKSPKDRKYVPGFDVEPIRIFFVPTDFISAHYFAIIGYQTLCQRDFVQSHETLMALLGIK